MPAEPASILVVDDDPDICANLADILADAGYSVDTAGDGEAALALVQKRAYDVALLDLKLPGMDGLELYRRIKAMRAGTVAIIVSAYVGGDLAAAALNDGAWKLLPKPIDFTRLFSMIEEAAQQPMVILVDDDPALCTSLWDVLRARDYRVCIAHSMEQAKQRIAERTYELALIDMKLPDADGVKVLRAVRLANPAARILVITGWRTEMQDRVDQAIAEGADAVCYKPFDVAALVGAMHKLTGEKHAATASDSGVEKGRS